MNKSIKLNREEFTERVETIKDVLSGNKYWINDRLNVRKRDNGFLVFLKVIVLPFARMFGCDPFNHTRIHRVAMALMSIYQDLENSLDYQTKENVSEILDKLEHRSTSKTTKKYLEVFTAHLTTPLVQLPTPMLQQVQDPAMQPIHEDVDLTETKEDKEQKVTIAPQPIKESGFTPTVNTYRQFIELHHRIMECVDQILSQEIECMDEVTKDIFYHRILAFKKDLRQVEKESWYPSLGRLQGIMLRNQLKFAFDELSGFREDYIENTRRLFEKSARDFSERYFRDEFE